MNITGVQLLGVVGFLIVLGLAAAVFSIGAFILWKIANSINELKEEVQSAAEVNDRVATNIKSAVDGLVFVHEKSEKQLAVIADLPKYVAGYGRIAGAQVKEIQNFRAAVEDFNGLISGSERLQKTGLISPKDSDDASRFFEVQSLLADNPGMSEQEAERKVDEANGIGMQLSGE